MDLLKRFSALLRVSFIGAVPIYTQQITKSCKHPLIFLPYAPSLRCTLSISWPFEATYACTDIWKHNEARLPFTR